jgi:nucleotide-binding universal stress UspA family protein
MRKIVVGYDGSEASRRALERAVEFLDNGGPVTVVTAVHLGSPTVHGATAILPEERAEQRERLEEARSLLSKRGIETRAIEGTGDPADVIVEEAKELGADLVLVGTHGKNVAKRLVLGSFSTKVVHDAPCDVLVVR